MLRAITFSFVILLTLFTVGCGNAASELAWVRSQGGVVGDSRLNRAQAACALLGSSTDRTLQVHVLDSASVGAYGWPNGNLFVTRGLVDMLTDDELAATIADELGHLLNDGHLHTVVSLRGCCVNADNEARADSIGVRLLAEHGIGCEAMTSMLIKVRSSAAVSPLCQRRIGQRIELLTEKAHSNQYHQNRN